MVYKKKKGVDPQMSSVAALMGKKGGSAKSEKKTAAARRNAQRAGARPTYHFTKKIQAKLGVSGEQICFVPDGIRAKIEEYRKKKSFVALWNGKKINVRFYPSGRGLHVQRIPGSRRPK